MLFRLDPEKSHALALAALHYLPAACFKKPMTNPVQLLGLTFPHRVGLAAGLDKDGDHLDALSKLGFAFIELGTVTPKAQPGNPKPRLFRLPKHKAIINRMGFNNKGVDYLVANIQRSAYQGILGINIGKNKDTPLDRAVEDYALCLEKVYPHASYITINISSPNTPDLRQLQQADHLPALLSGIRHKRQELAEKHNRLVPLLVKVSPDESEDSLKRMADLLAQFRIEGIIATNTTCSRNGLSPDPLAQEAGGLSGQPLFELSTASLRVLKKQVGNDLVLIGAGGVDSPATAQEKLAAGADLLQVYTGLIYKGPNLVAELAATL